MYTSKRPSNVSGPEDPFYLASRTIPLGDTRSSLWYLRQKVGVKKLCKLLKTMKEKVQLDPNKRITSHSARKYLVQKLRENEVQSTDIMQISGHKNINSVNSYSSISENKQREISNILSNTRSESLPSSTNCVVPASSSIQQGWPGNTSGGNSQW
jgi:hypothetical protein